MKMNHMRVLSRNSRSLAERRKAQSLLREAALSAASAALLTLPAAGQTLLFELDGEAFGDHFGRAVAGVGDLDGDGIPDFAVGAPEHSGNGDRAGRVRIYSGADASVLLSLDGAGAGNYFGSAIAGAGDVNLDGTPDLLIGAPRYNSTGRAHLYSGSDGVEIFRLDGFSTDDGFGAAVCVLPDVTGDGRNELVIGSPRDFGAPSNSGDVRVYSGASGQLVYRIQGQDSVDYFGSSVAALEDIDGDGAADLIVGAWRASLGGSHLGRAYFVSGVTGNTLRTVQGIDDWERLGLSVCGMNDLDGDGYGDVLIGAPGAFVNGQAYGAVRVYSGYAGIELDRVSSNPSSSFGGHVAPGGDHDGDGVQDFLVVAMGSLQVGPLASGLVVVYSGATLAPLFSIVGTDAGDGSEMVAANVGDLNGDGFDDILVGAHQAGYQNRGRARVYAGGNYCQPPVNYCSSLPNSSGNAALMHAVGAPSIGANDLELACTGAVPGQFGLFYYGLEQVSLPFGDGLRCVAGGFLPTFRLWPPVLADASGAARTRLRFHELPASNGPGRIYPGATWNFQFWFRDPLGGAAGFNLSDGLAVTFCL